MKNGEFPVKATVVNKETGKKERTVVGTAHFKIYETVEEAAEHLGPEKLLELLNSQVKTNEMNEVRGQAKGGPTAASIRNKAMARFTQEDWTACIGNEEAIKETLERYIAEIKAELAEENTEEQA